MAQLQTVAGYHVWVKELIAQNPLDQAMSMAVGGNYDALGQIERDLLIMLGLRPEHFVIDVGCGSGRLASKLASYLTGTYLGLDVIPELLAYARQRSPSHFRFEPAAGLTIPADDGSADAVCFFSVFTHLLQEESFLYLQEAARVLKPDGFIVISLLDFNVPEHWPIFMYSVGAAGQPGICNVFLNRDTLEVWCRHLQLEIDFYQDGGVPFIPLSEPVCFDDGQVAETQSALGPIGQSVARVRKL
jgi:SAM-dependent methyltransferase